MAFASPNWLAKIELNRMPIATIDVMFGTRYMTRYVVENRIVLFSMRATIVAMMSVGIVPIAHKMSVLPSDL